MRHVTITPTTIIANIKPGGWETWEEAQKDLTTIPSERKTVNLLRAEIRRHGVFRKPIEIHDHTTIGNGMHRTIAALLEGDAPIAAVFYEENDEQEVNGYYDLTIIATTNTVDTSVDFFDAMEETLGSALYSVRLNKDTWLCIDGGYGNHEEFRYFLSTDAPVDIALMQHIQQIAQDALNAHKITNVTVKVLAGIVDE